MCGSINDGVSFSHGDADSDRWDGGWVISFYDLERMYLLAKGVREVFERKRRPESGKE